MFCSAVTFFVSLFALTKIGKDYNVGVNHLMIWQFNKIFFFCNSCSCDFIEAHHLFFFLERVLNLRPRNLSTENESYMP